LDLLNSTFFSPTLAFKVEDDGHISFSYDAGDVTSLTSMGGSYTFVLNAGAVHSNNATETKGNTLTWKDPTEPMEAEVSAGGGGAGSVGLIIGLVLIGIVVLVVLAVVLLYLRGKRMQATPAPAPVVAPYQPPVAVVPPAEPPAPVVPPTEPPAPAQ
jgi:hypothetical protein